MDNLNLRDDSPIEVVMRHGGQIEARILVLRQQVSRRCQTLLDLEVAYMLSRASFPALRRGEASQLVACMEDVVAHGEVEDEGADDADPDEEVVGVNADFVPVAVDPAPDL